VNVLPVAEALGQIASRCTRPNFQITAPTKAICPIQCRGQQAGPALKQVLNSRGQVVASDALRQKASK